MDDKTKGMVITNLVLACIIFAGCISRVAIYLYRHDSSNT